MFKRFIVNLLFRLVESHSPLFEVSSLFGKKTPTEIEARKNKWRKALTQIYKNKDFIDYLFNQSDADLEKVFRGTSNPDMIRGARARILFLMLQMKTAHLDEKMKRTKSATEKKEITKEKIGVQKDYSKVVSFEK